MNSEIRHPLTLIKKWWILKLNRKLKKMYRILIGLLTLICFSGCKQTVFKIPNANKNVEIDYSEVFVKKDSTFSLRSYKEGLPFGTQYDFDSLNIIRCISWYHKMDSPFAYRSFNHLTYNTVFKYNKRFMDTSMIRQPIINYKELYSSKYFEIIFKDYPAFLVEVMVRNNSDPYVYAKVLEYNSAWYLEYSNDDDRDIILDFVYRDDKDVVIKEIKNVVVKNIPNRSDSKS